METKTLLITLLSVPLFFSTSFGAEKAPFRFGGNYDFQKRADARRASRWTLQEWLERKDRHAMMDLWLSFNSPSPFEFSLGGAYISATTSTDSAGVKTEEKHVSSSGRIEAYALLVGLSGEYENNIKESYNDVTGTFHLRLFGNSIQSTALTLGYGLRTREGGGSTPYRLAQQFGEGHLQLYIMKYFGIEGRYRSYLSVTEDTLGDTKGELQEAGAFIDFSAVRVFGTWYKENTTSTKNAVESKTDSTGIKSGIKIFF